MSEPFIGEIRVFSFDFAPEGWAKCDGQTIPINQNQALFSVIGKTYGGDGITNFRLPDMRGRTPINPGAGINLGNSGGAETVALNMNQMPQHTHTCMAANPIDALAGQASSGRQPSQNEIIYAAPATPVLMNQQSISSSGGSAAHSNMQPGLVLNFCIALNGIYPPRS